MTQPSHYHIGIQLLKTEQYEQAIVSFTAAIDENKSFTDAYCERGVTYFHMKRFDKALEDMDKAVELEPNNPYRYSSRAFIKAAAGDVKGGIKDYEKAIEIDPEDAIAHNNLGLLQEKLGYEKESKKSFDKADQISATNEDFKNFFSQTKRGNHGNSKVLDTSRNPKVDFVNATKKNQNAEHSFWSIIQSIFTKEGFIEFFSFIRSGFKIKE